jgi:hypothetical protein
METSCWLGTGKSLTFFYSAANTHTCPQKTNTSGLENRKKTTKLLKITFLTFYLFFTLFLLSLSITKEDDQSWLGQAFGLWMYFEKTVKM